MAKQTLSDRINAQMDSARADSACWADSEYRQLRLQSGCAKARLALEIKRQLARESARVEHEITLARAALIEGMDTAERESLRAAFATLAGIKVAEKSAPAESEALASECPPVAEICQ